MDFSDYKLSLELRIDWSDLDTYKHVNNVMFMKYQQSGRVNFWEASGLYELQERTNRGPCWSRPTAISGNHCSIPGRP